jgi:hypothetical protein
MPVTKLLERANFDPEAIGDISQAFKDALRDLGLNDRDYPLTEIVAKKIMEVAESGERDPERIRQQASLC